MSTSYNSWLFDSSQRDIIVDLYFFVVGNVIDFDFILQEFGYRLLVLVVFNFIHLKRNKFEASHPFIKSRLIGYHLLFDDQSKNILDVFDLDLMWNGFDIYENIWLNNLKWINMFELKCFFIKMIIPYISYFQIWFKLVDPWNCINVPY